MSIEKVPWIERIKMLPNRMSKDITKNLETFFVEHRLAKNALDRCNFEGGFLYFGESQQSKGRSLELIDIASRQKLISVDESNAIVEYIHNFNNAKTKDFISRIGKCSIKE